MSNINFEKEFSGIAEDIKNQMASRGYRVANTLRNSAVDNVLKGARHGRRYAVPGTGRLKYNKRNHTGRIYYRYYTASAPGEPPAVRTGAFRLSWLPKVTIDTKGQFSVNSAITSGIMTKKTKGGTQYLLGDILENGTGRMAPRPYKEQVQEKALKEIVRIYSEPY